MNRVDEALKSYHENYWGAGHETLLALADEYAKLRDETPITEEWAAKVRRLGVDLDYDEPYESWYFHAIGKLIKGGRSAIAGYVNTKGDVRALLLVAGIECDV